MKLASKQAAFDAVAAGIGIFAVTVGLGYQVEGPEGGVGAGFLPVVAGGIMTVFALLDIVLTRRGSTKSLETKMGQSFERDTERAAVRDAAPEARPSGGAAVEHPAPEGYGPDGTTAREPEAGALDARGRDQSQRNRTFWIVLALVLATIVLIPLLGFLVSTALLLMAVSVLVERRGLIRSAVVSAAILGFIYLIFVVLLGVPLPSGPLGF